MAFNSLNFKLTETLMLISLDGIEIQICDINRFDDELRKIKYANITK